MDLLLFQKGHQRKSLFKEKRMAHVSITDTLKAFTFGRPDDVVKRSNPDEDIARFVKGEADNAAGALQEPIKNAYQATRQELGEVIGNTLVNPFVTAKEIAAESIPKIIETTKNALLQVPKSAINIATSIAVTPFAIAGNIWQKVMAVARLVPSAVNVGMSSASQVGLRWFSGGAKQVQESVRSRTSNVVSQGSRFGNWIRNSLNNINIPGQQFVPAR